MLRIKCTNQIAELFQTIYCITKNYEYVIIIHYKYVNNYIAQKITNIHNLSIIKKQNVYV